MVGAMLNGQFILRFAICAASTTSEHIKYAWDIIQKETSKLLSSHNEECNGMIQKNGTSQNDGAVQENGTSQSNGIVQNEKK